MFVAVAVATAIVFVLEDVLLVAVAVAVAGAIVVSYIVHVLLSPPTQIELPSGAYAIARIAPSFSLSSLFVDVVVYESLSTLSIFLILLVILGSMLVY